jgi:hypothetical protein
MLSRSSLQRFNDVLWDVANEELRHRTLHVIFAII